MYRLSFRYLAALTVLGIVGIWALAQQPRASSRPDATQPQLAHFHHLHFNSIDPEAAIQFYTTRFNGERTRFGNADAVWTGKFWFLFNKVGEAPPSAIVASLYHLGWAAQDPKAAYQRLVEEGVKFETPLTDLFDLLGAGTPGRGYYAYVEGPDHALIELNGGATNDFQHVHLVSDDPVASSQWYVKEFGIPSRGPAPSREPRFNKGLQVGPLVFLNVDGVLFAWFPTGLVKGLYPKAWEGRTQLASSEGRVIDHFAFSVDNLDQTLGRLRADGVQVLGSPRASYGGKLRSAFVQAPDNVRLELVEGRPAKE